MTSIEEETTVDDEDREHLEILHEVSKNLKKRKRMLELFDQLDSVAAEEEEKEEEEGQQILNHKRPRVTSEASIVVTTPTTTTTTATTISKQPAVADNLSSLMQTLRLTKVQFPSDSSNGVVTAPIPTTTTTTALKLLKVPDLPLQWLRPATADKKKTDSDHNNDLFQPCQTDEYGVPILKLCHRGSGNKIIRMQPNHYGVLMVTEDADGIPIRLLQHQIEAVDSALQCEVIDHHGIRGYFLAFMMGLGKTVTAATVVMVDRFRRQQRGETVGPTLYVVLLSLIDSALEDIRKFYHSGVRILIFRSEYLGRDRWPDFRAASFSRFDIVITTFEVLTAGAKQLGHIRTKAETTLANGKARGGRATTKLLRSVDTNNVVVATTTAEGGASELFHFSWHRVIIDESQNIANPKGQVYQAALLLKSQYRMCTTGTPFCNVGLDVLSQFRFLGYRGCPTNKHWGKPLFEKHKLSERMLIMDYERAGVVLKPRRRFNHYPTMIGLQAKLYNLYLKIGKLNSKSSSSSSSMNMLVYLWQICAAPYLLTEAAQQAIAVGTAAASAKKAVMVVDDDAQKKKPDPRFRRDDFLSFDSEKARKGKLSPILWPLRLCCTRQQFVDALQKMDTSKSVEEAAVELEDWIEDIRGTAGMESCKVRGIRGIVQRALSDEGDDKNDNDDADHTTSSSSKTPIKVVIFTAFAKYAKLLEQTLLEEGYVPQQLAVLYGGKGKTIAQRKIDLQRFKSDVRCQILIITSGMGGVGHTFTVASYVIHAQVWWNQIRMDQEVYRCWRIGQKKTVMEWYVTTKGTVEDTMVEISSDKTEVGSALLKSATDAAAGEQQVDEDDDYIPDGMVANIFNKTQELL